MNLENEELEAGRIDNSAVARAMLKKTGIQAILDREDITEVAVNQGNRIFFEGKNGCFQDACSKVRHGHQLFLPCFS